MNADIKALSQALESNLELVRLLSDRISALERPAEDNAAQQMAVMLVLRAFVQCSPNREQVLSLIDRMAAQMQIQPAILLGSQTTFAAMKQHLDWITAPGRAAD